MDPGFQTDRVLMLGLPLPPKRYSTYEQRTTFSESVLDRVKAIPGVQAASIGNGGLPFGGPNSAYSIDGHPQTTSRQVVIDLISANYTRTLGIARSEEH